MFIKKLREHLFNKHNVEEHKVEDKREDNIDDNMKNNIKDVQDTDSINKDDRDTNTSTPDNLGSDSTNINKQNTNITSRQSMQNTDKNVFRLLDDISLHTNQ